MIITISEQYGSAGYWIGEGLAKRLGYKFVNDEVFNAAMNNSDDDLKSETFSYFEQQIDDTLTTGIEAEDKMPEVEKSGKGLRGQNDILPMQKYINNLVSSLSLDVSPLSWDMDAAQKKVLNAFADEGNCVIMGKCSDYYLNGRDNKLSIFTMDDMSKKVERIMNRFNVDAASAEKAITKADTRRDNYHRYFSGTGVGDMEYFDMTIRTSLMSVPQWIDVFEEIVKRMEG